MPRAIKSLSDLKADTHAFVHHIIGRQLNNRLLVLGFTIGTEVIVLQNYGRGPIILSVRDFNSFSESIKVLSVISAFTSLFKLIKLKKKHIRINM